MPLNKRTVRKRKVIFSTFFICCLGASLLAAALATENWFESDCESVLSTGSCHINFGLFEGKRLINQYVWNTHYLKVVCLEGDCMYSCAYTKALRQQQLRQVMNGTPLNFSVSTYCSTEEATRAQVQRGVFPPVYVWESPAGSDTGGDSFPVVSSKSFASQLIPGWWRSSLYLGFKTDAEKVTDHDAETSLVNRLTVDEAEAEVEDTETETTTTSDQPVDPVVFMDYGLWVGTIACLSLGMMFAVVGALFAVINTATTPVEAITGVPGLYIWNSLAALFNLICVILWAVQFHENLTKNVLLYDAPHGWTTEGMEVFGYSFWLVVVAIFVHVANIAIIFIGTYEPKAKDQVQAPDTKGSNIMLY